MGQGHVLRVSPSGRVGSGFPGACVFIPLSCERCRTETEFTNKISISTRILGYSKGVSQGAKRAKGFVGLCGSKSISRLRLVPASFGVKAL